VDTHGLFPDRSAGHLSLSHHVSNILGLSQHPIEANQSQCCEWMFLLYLCVVLFAEANFHLVYSMIGVLCFIFYYRHYELVVRGLNTTFMKVKRMINLKTFHWHLKDGTIGSLEEISSQYRSIGR
jgi:hypothetical protein